MFGGIVSFAERFQFLLDSEQATPESIHITEEIIETIQKEYKIILDETNGASLVTHLAVTLKKIKAQENLLEMPEICVNEALSYKEEMAFAEKIAGFLKKAHQIDFNRSETAFLAIHLRNINQHLEKKEVDIQK